MMINSYLLRIVIAILAATLGIALYNQALSSDERYSYSEKRFIQPQFKGEAPAVLESLGYDRILLTRAEIKAAKDAIWGRWNVTYYPNFIKTMHIPEKSFEIQKWKFQKLLLENVGTSSFVVGFTGSSVTAGHDNYFNESYPVVFLNTLAPIFATLGIRLEVTRRSISSPALLCSAAAALLLSFLPSFLLSLHCCRSVTVHWATTRACRTTPVWPRMLGRISICSLGNSP